METKIKCTATCPAVFWQINSTVTKTRLFKYSENFTTKTGIFHISAQNIEDCGYSLELPQWGSSNKYRYPQSMFLSRNKKINVYPCKPQYYCINVGFKGVKAMKACFYDGYQNFRTSMVKTSGVLYLGYIQYYFFEDLRRIIWW